MKTRGIVQSTQAFERWLIGQVPTTKADFKLKHAHMRESPFPFLRATFYRWMELWPQICPELNKAPKLLAVGDLHLENFGTWRDAEGRLAWGINDFDEAYPLPYTLDLVRLTTSALLFAQLTQARLPGKTIATAILEGYHQGLQEGGQAFVLEELHPHLRELALNIRSTPAEFWSKLQALPSYRGHPPREATKALRRALPEGSRPRFSLRQAGLGSLGRVRVVGQVEWQGGLLAREAKPLAPSAAAWVASSNPGLHYATVLERAIRSPDPFMRVRKGWVVRRLSPYNVKIDIDPSQHRWVEEKLLLAMGKETANVHLGSGKALKAVLKDLQESKNGWLLEAAEAMAEATTQDFEQWKHQS